MTGCLMCPECRGSHTGGLCALALFLESIVQVHCSLQEASNGRMRTSEEGMTYSLARYIEGWQGGPTGIRVSALEVGRIDESVNGTDLEIWLNDRTVDPASRWSGWRVQAKRAARRRLKDGIRSQDDPYRVEGLDKRTKAEQQCDLLIDKAQPILGLAPFYWIYADTAVAKGYDPYRSLNIGPIQVIPAQHVKSRIESYNADGRRPTGWNWLNQVAADGRSLHSLWCPSGRSADSNPLAIAGRRAWIRQRDAATDRDLQGRPTNGDQELVDGDAVANPPDYVRSILDQSGAQRRYESLLVLERN